MDIIVLDILDTLRNFIYYANDSQFVLTLKIKTLVNCLKIKN